MKFLARLFIIYIPALLLTFILLTAVVLSAMGMLNTRGMKEAWDFARANSFSALVAVLKVEFLGVADMATDPSYGRELVEGRGHAPWVIRGNLDEQPRMLSFALSPGIWASYRTESASLYQVWQGELGLFGAAYDYRHGPQPVSGGQWLLRNEMPAQWYVRFGEEPIAAQVHYLGHGYGPGRKTAFLRYELTAGDKRLELRETPEIELADDRKPTFIRKFEIYDSKIQAGFSTTDGAIVWLEGDEMALRVPLGAGTELINREHKRELEVAEDSATRGKQVIANSDCLSCHSETQRVVGPAFARIAQRFRGRVQQGPLDSLTTSIINGSRDKWGPVPMTAHPQMSREDAQAAVTYILGLGDIKAEHDVPLDASGQAYASTWNYEVGPRLESLHPAFSLENLIPPGFEPKVGGMDFRNDGKLVLSSWDKDGAVFLIDLDAPIESRVQRIAEGLQEPLGLRVVDDRIFVLQKQELTELVDLDGDEIIDEYRNFSSAWPTSANFHSFAFGLAHKDDSLYGLLSICVLPGGASCPDQLPSQGKVLRISLADGSVEFMASGFRTPNGIGIGPDNGIFVNDNQGDWLPSSKLLHIQPGNFYGSRAVADAGVMSAKETPPVVWLPQDEIGNSPTEPFLLTEGPYAGQMMHGDVYHGGVKRVFMERVQGRWQGAVFRFSGGFMGGVNRFARGPDNAIYVGEIGNPPNWGQVEKSWFGLERMTYSGKPVHEILEVRAQPDGFSLVLGKPLKEGLDPVASDLIARQWFYHPTEQYGGPKYDPTELKVESLSLSKDRTVLHAKIPGLKQGYVVYLNLDKRLLAGDGEAMWANEAWYTLNHIPANPTAIETQVQPLSASTPLTNTLTEAEVAAGWQLLFDGESLGRWRNYGSHDSVEYWKADDGALAFKPGNLGMLNMIKSALFGGGSGDLIYSAEKFENFELSLEWKISENGNSGIFYYVADEEQKTPWLTGIEMQVLDNDGHPDGKIHTHRAGDLYDLVAADPETALPHGHWNKVRIRVENNLIEHWLNDVKVVSIQRFSPRWNELVANSKFNDMPDFGTAASGYIVLQDHGDPVWYRNIKIRKL
jgi:cytochrome c551/c552